MIVVISGIFFRDAVLQEETLERWLLRLMTLPNIWPRAKPSLALPTGHRQGLPQFARQLLRRRREETGRDAVRNTKEGLHAGAGARSIMAAMPFPIAAVGQTATGPVRLRTLERFVGCGAGVLFASGSQAQL
jgi:hypothetical protein